jgi:hypothetical protein
MTGAFTSRRGPGEGVAQTCSVGPRLFIVNAVRTADLRGGGLLAPT